MSKIAVVYWSGTGNTEIMANCIAAGAKGAGAEVDLFTADAFSADKVGEYTGLAFGCPSMGAEQLEESEFEPMWEGVKGSLAGKKVALFGSYGWGDGEWMRTWEDECPVPVIEAYICNETPEEDGENHCKELGTKLV